MALPPEQLLVHARVYLSRGQGEDLPYRIAVDLTRALATAVEEIRRLRERVVDLEQERFE